MRGYIELSNEFFFDARSIAIFSPFVKLIKVVENKITSKICLAESDYFTAGQVLYDCTVTKESKGGITFTAEPVDYNYTHIRQSIQAERMNIHQAMVKVIFELKARPEYKDHTIPALFEIAKDEFPLRYNGIVYPYSTIKTYYKWLKKTPV